MFEKTDEEKVLRDPVHGYVHIEEQVVWDCINTAWFQRLRRIRQLGGAFMVYHCAEHTRFSHSLGVYEIVRRLVHEVPDIDAALSEREKVTAELAGLLHDIGHGPYSHAFESISRTHHENYTAQIIENDTEITRILESAAPGLSHEVADVIRHASANPLLYQLISSQLDADRMDYLLRDAYFTGTKYGEFDLERILRTLRVYDGRQLVVKESGVYAVENYIMARYHMYWQVYYHPVARSFECVFNSLFKRLRDLGNEKDEYLIEPLRPVIHKRKINLRDYFMLDESSVGYGFQRLVEHPDPIVRDLAMRIRDRNLFEYENSDKNANKELKQRILDAGYDPRYYLGSDAVEQRPYVPYAGESENGAIWIRRQHGEVAELSNVSNIVYSLIHGPSHDDAKVFFPGEICGLK